MVEILNFVQHFLDTLWSDNDGAAVDSLKTQWEPSAADFKSIRPNQWYLQPQTVLNDLGLETPLICSFFAPETRHSGFQASKGQVSNLLHH